MQKKYKLAIDKTINYVLLKDPKPFAIILHGSVARGDNGPYSDVDITAIIEDGICSKEESLSLRFSKFFDGIFVTVGYFRMCDFVTAFGTRDPWEVLWKKVYINPSIAIYDPYSVWEEIKNACVIEVTPQIKSDIYYTFLSGAIVYLGKLKNATIKMDKINIYDSACTIAHNIAYIILALNDLYPVSWKMIYNQISSAEVRPEHFHIDYPVAAGYVRQNITPNDVVNAGYRLVEECQKLIKNELGKGKDHEYLKELCLVDLKIYKTEISE